MEGTDRAGPLPRRPAAAAGQALRESPPGPWGRWDDDTGLEVPAPRTNTRAGESQVASVPHRPLQHRPLPKSSHWLGWHQVRTAQHPQRAAGAQGRAFPLLPAPWPWASCEQVPAPTAIQGAFLRGALSTAPCPLPTISSPCSASIQMPHTLLWEPRGRLHLHSPSAVRNSHVSSRDLTQNPCLPQPCQAPYMPEQYPTPLPKTQLHPTSPLCSEAASESPDRHTLPLVELEPQPGIYRAVLPHGPWGGPSCHSSLSRPPPSSFFHLPSGLCVSKSLPC